MLKDSSTGSPVGEPGFELGTFREPVAKTVSLPLSHRRPYSSRVEEYEKAKVFFNNTVDLFSKIKIGTGGWKPIQTGVIMATRSI